MLRECGSCTLCCKLIEISELNKSAGTWCENCKVGVGCTIYENRPEVCKKFECLWLQNNFIRPELKPNRTKVVMFHNKVNDNSVVYIIEDVEGNAIKFYMDFILSLIKLNFSIMLYFKNHLHHCYIKENVKNDLQKL